jgi:spore maturation protein CgeB
MKPQPLRIVFLGLSLSSSWGNGHATTYRALVAALAARGHHVLFLEREQPWYASNRDLTAPPYCELRFYDSLQALRRWSAEIQAADAVIVGSFVPQGAAVSAFVLEKARGLTAFYDIDTPVTLAKLKTATCEYLTPELIPSFDLYLSFTSGPALRYIEAIYGAPAARALYCSVDPRFYRRVRVPRRWEIGYLGTYSADRQPALERLLLAPARRSPQLRFVVAGALYPADMKWPANVERIDHLPPSAHAKFYSSLGWALNVTRADMISLGYSPSVRLFEAAACGTPIISDAWTGIDDVFAPHKEIVVASGQEDVVAALARSPDWRRRLGSAAKRRVLASHTADHRAGELENYLSQVSARTHAAVVPELAATP